MRSAKSETLLFLFFVAVIILDRILLLQEFGFRFTDNDQMLYWQGATDYANGIFHEPYFYGQDYNYMLEALLAVPLLWMGVKVQYALPIITNLLSVLPFITAAIILKRNGAFRSSLIFLAIPVLMPVEYGMLTSLSRGFISGLAVTGFLVYGCLYPKKKLSWLIFGSISAIAYILNPNSILFCFPIGVFLLLVNYKAWEFYLFLFISALPFFIIQYFSKRFYVLNPDYKVHGMWDLHFNINDISLALNKLDKMMDFLSPVFWFWGWSVLILILLIILMLIRKSPVMAISLTMALLLILTTLGVNKIHDYYETIFFAGSRMFLALPLIGGLAMHWFIIHYSIKVKFLVPFLSALCIMAFSTKAEINSIVVNHHIEMSESQRIARNLNQLKLDCENFKKVIDEYNPDIIIFVPDWRRGVPYMEFYNYGCPLMIEDFTPTLLNIYERRSWVFLQEKDKLNETVLIFGGMNFEQLNKLPNTKTLTVDPDLIVIKQNTFTTKELMDTLHLDYLRARY